MTWDPARPGPRATRPGPRATRSDTVNRDQEVLRFIRHWQHLIGKTPTRAEINEFLGVSGRAAADRVVARLVRQGYIEIAPGNTSQRQIVIKSANTTLNTENL